MNKTRINFLCPTPTVRILDAMAEADHRDRSSMLNKIIDYYLKDSANGHAHAVGEAKAVTAKKKAGTR